MLKKDVKVGRTYLVKVNDGLVPVRLDSPGSGTNLKTGRKVAIKSAAKLRREVSLSELERLSGLTSAQLWDLYQIDTSCNGRRRSEKQQQSAEQPTSKQDLPLGPYHCLLCRRQYLLEEGNTLPNGDEKCLHQWELDDGEQGEAGEDENPTSAHSAVKTSKAAASATTTSSDSPPTARQTERPGVSDAEANRRILGDLLQDELESEDAASDALILMSDEEVLRQLQKRGKAPVEFKALATKHKGGLAGGTAKLTALPPTAIGSEQEDEQGPDPMPRPSGATAQHASQMPTDRQAATSPKTGTTAATDNGLLPHLTKTMIVQDGDTVLERKSTLSEFADGPSRCRNIPGRPDTLPDAPQDCKLDIVPMSSCCKAVLTLLNLNGRAAVQCDKCKTRYYIDTVPAQPKSRPAMHDVPKPNGFGAHFVEVKQQEAEREAADIRSGIPHIIGKARAGTGKTWTGLGGLRKMRGQTPEHQPSPQQQAIWDAMQQADARYVAFCAYNAAIAAEAAEKLKQYKLDKSGIRASTMHSLGNYALLKALGKKEIVESRSQRIIAVLLGRAISELRKQSPVVLKGTAELVSLCKQTLADPTPDALMALVRHYDVDLSPPPGERADEIEEQVLELVPRVLAASRDVSGGMIDYDDQIWLPLALNLPVFTNDLVIVDEAQDLNRARQELAKRIGKRIMLIGDEKQAIYGFSGADAIAMRRMATDLSATPRGLLELALTVTRRCGKAIVREAQRLVPDFEAHDSNPEGEVAEALFPSQTKWEEGGGRRRVELPIEQTYVPMVKDGDFILCRTNATLVAECFRFIRLNRKANIQGRNIGENLITTVEKMGADSVSDLLKKLESWYRTEQQRENDKDLPSETRLQALTDKYECLTCFCDGLPTVDQVVARIRSIFTDNSSAGVRMSSIHRAKGLEAQNVFYLRPEGSEPRTDRMQAWEREQERNLEYVAITRAISTLTYVY